MPKKMNSRNGQTLIEFALVLPLLFLLIVNVVNFGGLFYAVITTSNAARSGAQYMTMGPNYANIGGVMTLPDPTKVKDVVAAEMATLRYATYDTNNHTYSSTTTVVNVCSNNYSSGTKDTPQLPETCLTPYD